jgi:aminoglycoside/choline kinase family phosphotransferase
MKTDITKKLSSLYRTHTGTEVIDVIPLPQGGSDRQYFRLTNRVQSIIGAYNPDVEENRAYFYLTKHFFNSGFPVAELLSVSEDETYYLVCDLGDLSLLHKLTCTIWEKSIYSPILDTIKKSLELLAKLQIEGAKDLDFSKCYPKSDFDLQSVMWDFNYFKYCFLKPSGIRFNESKLEEDFLAFANVLLSHSCNYFLYRDFQSRNIMLVNNEPYLIDYQGGRRGPLLYDVASFLYQAKANFPQWLRVEMLDFYLEKVKELTSVDTDELKEIFPAFALFRVIQTLGAYGYRGFFERRSHFLQSVPLASSNLQNLISDINIALPSLISVLEEISRKYGVQHEQNEDFEGLIVEVSSFSFKKGYPLEHAEHGGGFVFDCRSLPNPGRLNEYKELNGFDIPVVDYLTKHIEVSQYLERVEAIVKESVNAYLKRGFNYLSVAFGCTGGQHRSVYMANRLAKSLQKVEGLRVKVNHRELNL